MARTHLIGLLLGTEEDWSGAFEALLARIAPSVEHGGERHEFRSERVTIEPFDLRATPRHSLVIDRLAHWYYVPREWLKKIALMDGVYLMNNPFTFQSMEKHSAYCAMMRLGLKVPETWLVPYKQPVADERFAYTASRYNQPFDLPEIAAQIGYPLFMKPFDGGAWVGVSQVRNARELAERYDDSGQRLMHLQKSVDGFEVFARSLSIGPETMVMRFDPVRPQHDRYQVDHDFLDARTGDEVITIGRTVNAFFRWEFNSCETLIRDGEVFPIDYANACPDVSLISLHYYFPWAIKALLRWSVFCCATGRPMRVAMDPAPWFEAAARDTGYEEKLAAYRALADADLAADEYAEFCERALPEVDEAMAEYIGSPDFDDLLVETVTRAFPPAEHEQFVAHYRGLLGAWVRDQAAA
jgi:hypothetical protein